MDGAGMHHPFFIIGYSSINIGNSSILFARLVDIYYLCWCIRIGGNAGERPPNVNADAHAEPMT